MTEDPMLDHLEENISNLGRDTVDIGKGFLVDDEALELYWDHVSDRLKSKKYRSVTDIQTLENRRRELHDFLVKSAKRLDEAKGYVACSFDPDLRYESDEKQHSTGYYDFKEALEDYIATRLAQEEGGVTAMNRRILGI